MILPLSLLMLHCKRSQMVIFFPRCHRIGQTRDVHIYRMVSERTVEENILKKANQKRMLGDLAIEGGNFTTAFFKKQTISDLFEVDENTLQVILNFFAFEIFLQSYIPQT